MNKKEAFLQLNRVLEEYQNQEYRFHRFFIKELADLVTDAKGHEKELFMLLVKQLCFVSALKRQVHLADSNEKIKYLEKEYYSLHLSAKNFNIRMLMTFDNDDNPVFLAAFYERAGKRNTDYTKWKMVLAERYKE